MRIELPVLLSASFQSRYDYDADKSANWVVIQFGNSEVTKLVPTREVSNYTYNRDEEEREIAEETAAEWLREKLA